MTSKTFRDTCFDTLSGLAEKHLIAPAGYDEPPAKMDRTEPPLWPLKPFFLGLFVVFVATMIGYCSPAKAATTIRESCSWDAPRGMYPVIDPAAVVDNYSHIPKATRAKLKKRIAARKYDEIATIRRDTIQGEYAYAGLRNMNFGDGKMCREVRRDRWTAADVERGLVYCEDGHCLIVPTVCRNTSEITRGPKIPPPPYIPEETSAPVDPLPVAVAAPIPPIVVPGIPDVPTTFSDQGQPPPVPRDAYPEPVSVRQEFFDPWSRPIFGPVNRLFVTADLPIQAPLVPLPPMQTPQAPMPPMPPVPGVVPPAPVDLPDRPGDAVAPVPELSTWALMLGGLLGVWMMTRRRV